MKDRTKKLADKLTPPPNKSIKQMGTNEIREFLRPIVPDLIIQALCLVEEADNDSVRLGAIKTLLNKVLPDMKSVEYKDQNGNQIMPSYIVLGKVDENTANQLAKKRS